MTITYKLLNSTLSQTEPNCVLMFVDGEPIVTIPFDPDNSEYQKYLKWLDGYELQGMQWVKTSEGNTPLPPDPTPEPEPLTPQQKLEAAGLSIEELKGLLGL